MNLDTHVLRPLFYVNTVMGLSTVSLSTMDRCGKRCVNCCFWIVVYIIEFSLCLVQYFSTDEVTTFQILTWSAGYLLVLHLLVQSLSDHRTVLAAALSLQAVRGRLEAEGLPLGRLSAIYGLSLLLVLTNALLTLFNAARAWLYTTTVQAFTSYFTSFHFIGMQSAHAFSYLSLSFKLLQVQAGVARALREGLEEAAEEFVRTRDSRRKRLLRLAREMKGALSHVEEDVHAYFKLFLTYRLLLACILLPRIAHFTIFEKDMESSVLKNGILVASVVIVSMFTVFAMFVNNRLAAQEPEVMTTLYEYCLSYQSQKKKKVFRRQMLAGIHRVHVPSCWIFDVEFSLLMSLLDTALLVFLTMSSSIKQAQA